MKLSTQILAAFTMVILLSIADSYTNTLAHEIAGSIVPGNFKLEIGNLPNLFTERIKTKQVFTNQISNTVKYTPRYKKKV